MTLTLFSLRGGLKDINSVLPGGLLHRENQWREKFKSVRPRDRCVTREMWWGHKERFSGGRMVN